MPARPLRGLIILALSRRHDGPPIAVEPKVMKEEMSRSPSATAGRAVGEDQVAQAAGVNEQQAADQEHGDG